MLFDLQVMDINVHQLGHKSPGQTTFFSSPPAANCSMTRSFQTTKLALQTKVKTGKVECNVNEILCTLVLDIMGYLGSGSSGQIR